MRRPHCTRQAQHPCSSSDCARQQRSLQCPHRISSSETCVPSIENTISEANTFREKSLSVGEKSRLDSKPHAAGAATPLSPQHQGRWCSGPPRPAAAANSAAARSEKQPPPLVTQSSDAGANPQQRAFPAAEKQQTVKRTRCP